MRHFRNPAGEGSCIRYDTLDCLVIPVFGGMNLYIAQHGTGQRLEDPRLVPVHETVDPDERYLGDGDRETCQYGPDRVPPNVAIPQTDIGAPSGKRWHVIAFPAGKD